MSEIKLAAMEMIRRMPDDVSWELMAYKFMVRAKIEQGVRSIEMGNFKTHDEVVKEMDEWRKSKNQQFQFDQNSSSVVAI